jgi:hypothetical protein
MKISHDSAWILIRKLIFSRTSPCKMAIRALPLMAVMNNVCYMVFSGCFINKEYNIVNSHDHVFGFYLEYKYVCLRHFYFVGNTRNSMYRK